MGTKIIKLILALCALAFLAGCAGNRSGSDEPLPTPVAVAPLPALLVAPKGESTIAWLSDTQYYSKIYPDTFLTMTRFLSGNAEKMNLGYVIHTGDIVQDYDDEDQWRAADDAMRLLDGIPSGVLAGNHDVDGSKQDYSYFSRFFGEDRYENGPWYGGGERDNRSHCDLIELDGMQYIFVYLGFSPDEESIGFANKAFSSYPERVGVLCVHEYLDTDSTLTNIGKTLQKRVVEPNSNVFLVLCGHRYTSDWTEASFDDDGDGVFERTVYQIIANYQSLLREGGRGYLRLMRVDRGAGVIRMFTYSPVLGDFNYYDAESWRDEFTLPIPWD
ncbi:MAG: metallophosphoesterase [Bacillota bacterium]